MTVAERFYANNEMVNTPPIPCNFQVGDQVMFTNEYGIEFGPFKVIGFTKPEHTNWGNFIHLDFDSPWAPVKLYSITKLN